MNLPMTCPVCGIAYTNFRTGYTFRDVKEMLWVNSENPDDWKYKRKNTVLGRWRQIKMEMWRCHIETCNFEMLKSRIEKIEEY